MKKLLFSLILFFSFKANANLHSLWNFPKEWTDKLLKECEPTFIEEYKEFPKEYHALKAPERVFYCVYMLEEAGYDISESDNWFRHAKMKNQFEYEYERIVGKIPYEYYLLPKWGSARTDWLQERVRKKLDKNEEAEYQKKKDNIRKVANVIGFADPVAGLTLTVINAVN
jgi:hypothetical protein